MTHIFNGKGPRNGQECKITWDEADDHSFVVVHFAYEYEWELKIETCRREELIEITTDEELELL